MPSRTLRNASIVITGASSGIGQAAAYAFAAEGANVVLAARNEPALERVAEDCRRRGVQAVWVATDVGDAQQVKELAAIAADRFERIDIWINNAGIGAIGPFTETPVEAHERVIRTNLLGCLHGAHAVLPYFQKQRRGVLINTNSEGGWAPAPYAVAYTASKFGLRGLSAALRSELSSWPDIHVCDVFPQFTDTPAFHHAGNYIGREIKPMPPICDSRQVAAAMISLARRPRRELTVGHAATWARVGYACVPGFIDRGVESLARRYFRRARQVAPSDGNLFSPPADEPGIDGGWRRPRREPSLATAGAFAAVAAGCLLLWSR